MASAVKVMLFTSVSAESETAVWLEKSKIAAALVALGTVAGFQLPTVFQSELVPPTQV